jgi:hypothetical protein
MAAVADELHSVRRGCRRHRGIAHQYLMNQA